MEEIGFGCEIDFVVVGEYSNYFFGQTIVVVVGLELRGIGNLCRFPRL